MSEETENWWDSTSGEGKQGGPDAPEPITIRGYRREGDQWVQNKAKDAMEESSGGASESPLSEIPNYHMQKIGATALFFVSFVIGDWWWDGSNGFSALINSFNAVLEMPGSLLGSYDFWTSQPGLNAFDAILITISWSLWMITPPVFLWGFIFSWRGYGGGAEYHSGRKSYIFLTYFSVALISMDFLSFVVLSEWGIWAFFDYWDSFLEWHLWHSVAIIAAICLNPDYDFVGRLMPHLAKE